MFGTLFEVEMCGIGQELYRKKSRGKIWHDYGVPIDTVKSKLNYGSLG